MSHSAAYVIGRNNFRSSGRTASLGRYNFAFMWAAVACLFLAMVMFCVGGAASRSKSSTYTKRTGGKSFMGRRQKSQRDRGSFIGTDGQRKMREYSP